MPKLSMKKLGSPVSEARPCGSSGVSADGETAFGPERGAAAPSPGCCPACAPPLPVGLGAACEARGARRRGRLRELLLHLRRRGGFAGRVGCVSASAGACASGAGVGEVVSPEAPEVVASAATRGAREREAREQQADEQGPQGCRGSAHRAISSRAGS